MFNLFLAICIGICLAMLPMAIAFQDRSWIIACMTGIIAGTTTLLL